MIPWNLIGLFFSGAAERLLKGLSAALEWVLADVRNALLALFVPMLFVASAFTIPGLRADLAASEQLVEDTQLAHLGTISNFIDASKQAQRDAEANAARVKAEQEKITDATLANLRADRAALHARFDRLRARDAARADPRRADPAGLPGAGQAPGRAAAPSGEDRLPAPGSLSLEDALIASEQALQLNALIDWVEKQSAVRFTPEEPRR